MIFEEMPENFNPWYHTVTAFIFNPKGEVLFLRRGATKREGGKFGIPGGKREENEKSIQTVIREIREETGINMTGKDLKACKTVHVRYDDHDFLFEMFETSLDHKPEVKININEHSEFIWATLEEALEKLPLVQDMDSCIKLFKSC